MRGSTNARMRAVTREHPIWRSFSNLQVERPRVRCGTLTLISGCMFSGKTTELLRRVARYDASQVAAFKHTIDTRYDTNEIVSHAGKAYPARAVTGAAEILARLPRRAELVAIDETQFFDLNLVDVVTILVRRGRSVILTALDPNSWGIPFEVVERLKPLADETVSLCAVCSCCGSEAHRTQRLTPIVGGNMVDGPENYEPRCVMCWSAPPEPTPV